MALVNGTNCGFVLVAPTADPEGTNFTATNNLVSGRFQLTTPNQRVTEMGLYVDNATAAETIFIGIYSHDSTNNKPDVLLVSGSFAKGTTSGWKSGSISYSPSAGVNYWLATAMTDGEATSGNNAANAGEFYVGRATFQMPDPWGAAEDTGNQLMGIYARYEAIPAGEIPRTGFEIGQQQIKTDFPVVESLAAADKHHGSENNLVPEEKSLINKYGNQTRGLG